MSVLDSLPDRPLTDAELASLNRADAVALAVDVTDAAETASAETTSGETTSGETTSGETTSEESADTDEEEPTPGDADANGVEGLLLATDAWLRGLAYDADGGGWRVVESESLADEERFDAMRACEDAVREALAG